MILEGVVTTMSPSAVLNIAPMGPKLGPDLGLRRFELRPFRTSTTFQNLETRREGVFHVTDDVLLMAQSAIGHEFDPPPELHPAQMVNGWILAGSCRYHEFKVVEFDDQLERARIIAETVHEGRIRDFLGFNRARRCGRRSGNPGHANGLSSAEEILAQFDRLGVIVSKTGGRAEDLAFHILHEHVCRNHESSCRDTKERSS